MNPEQHARQLLERLDLRHPCDLDLLVFFARHPRTLLASEQLAAFMGYGLEQIAESLEALLGAGFLTRTSSSNHAARMYVFVSGGPNDEWLPPLVQFVSMRDGRLAMRRALARRSAAGRNGPSADAQSHVRIERGPAAVLAWPTPEQRDDADLGTRRTGGR